MRILFKLNPYLQQRQRQRARWIFPIKLAMYATALFKSGNDIVWDGVDDGSFDRVVNSEEQIDIPFLELPHADRVLTDAKNKKWQKNGNFKRTPSTYLQVANGCWHGKCSFCVEQKNKWQVRPVESVIEELEECNKLGFKEVFDDSGTFPIGNWLQDFCERVIRANYNFRLGCNMRMAEVDYSLMRRAGFRMLLYGIESANQYTLDRINKGVKLEDIKYIEKASNAGLDCHIAVMFGYPWESDDDALRTLSLVHSLLKRGIAKTAQASFYTHSGEQSKESHRKYVKRIYEVAYSPQFWFNQIRDIKSMDDLKYLWRKIREGLRCH